MDLGHFTSLFEVFCAFNFAYTLSDTFTVTLNNRMLHSFSYVKANLKNIQSKLNVGKRNLYELSKIKNDEIDTGEKLQAIKDKLTEFDNTFHAVKRDTYKSIKLAGLTKSFRFLCFFNALYSVFILATVGFLTDDRTWSLNNCSIKNALLLANIFCLGFQIKAIRKDRLALKDKTLNTKIIGYRTTLIYFVFLLAVAIIFYGLNFLIFSWQWTNNYMDTLIIFSSLLVPSFHFIYYFLRAYQNSVYIGDALYQNVQKFENTYDAYYSSTVTPAIDFHNYYKEMAQSKVTLLEVKDEDKQTEAK